MKIKGTNALKKMPAVLFIIISLAVAASSFAAAQSVLPVTTMSLSGTSGSGGWYKSDVVVSLVASDLSNTGISRTEYSHNGSIWIRYTGPFNVTKEGMTAVYYRSIDNASGVEQMKTIVIGIDKTAPTIRAILTPQPNANGWISKDVQLHFEVSDDVSGISERPSDATLTNEGTYSTLSGRVTDVAGNQANIAIPTFYIDKTPPVLGGLTMDGNTYTDVYIATSASVNEANPDRIEWDWGDGIGSQATFSNNVARGLHAYKRAGKYTVTLNVVDKAGNAAKSTAQVTVNALAGSGTPTPEPTPAPIVTPTPTPIPLPSPTATPTPSAGLLLTAITLTAAGLFAIRYGKKQGD